MVPVIDLNLISEEKKVNMSYVKVIFNLKRDEDGYPPADVESLWAEDLGDSTYKIDNIPFYVRNISVGDVVDVNNVDGILCFRTIVRHSLHSTYRILIGSANDFEKIRADLNSLGCSVEKSHLPSLASIDVPPQCDAKSIHNYMLIMESLNVFEFEEASLRGALADL